MQLEDFRPAWKQHQLLSTIQHFNPNDILSIIDKGENTGKTNLQAVLLNVIMVIVITICCQGG
ncbi:MAG: hypothetical protein HWE07_08810 [Cytophagia bacterium]|nr:hypothetical protein [Cytophagia bacterium]